MAEIKTKKGHTFQIDDEEYPRISAVKWHGVERADGQVYARNLKLGYLQRYVLNADFEQVVEFIDGNSFNCRRSNLRITDRMAVQKEAHAKLDRPAKYLRHDPDGRWSVIIPGVGYIGRRDTAAEAAELRDEFLSPSGGE